MKANTVFIILHVLAVLFGLWGLVITVPLHLIFKAIGKDS
jgi:predicted PurR-regulated permease PerM